MISKEVLRYIMEQSAKLAGKIPYYKMHFKGASTKVNFSKYEPHQGKKECARRMRNEIHDRS